MEFSAPPPPVSAAGYMPDEADSFAEGLWSVLEAAMETLSPALHDSLQSCLRVLCAVLLTALAGQLTGKKVGAELAGIAAVSALLLEPSAELMSSGLETVRELRSYGNLLLPVMASALAACGGVTASSALYAGTAVFDSLLSGAASRFFEPMLGAFVAMSIASGTAAEPLLGKIRDLIRFCVEWSLKLLLYLFTGYMTVTGIFSGTADAAAGKAAKIALSGAVPVVGGILSDAADAVVLSASMLGNGAGIWGIFTVLAIFFAPAIRIGMRYLLLKLTAAIGSALGAGRTAQLIEDFATAMGLLLALVSTQAVLLLISVVCFLKGTVS